MKQHITQQQLDGFLSVDFSSGKCLWNKALQKKLSYEMGIHESSYPQGHLVTIGKMIEILDDKYTKDLLFISRLEDFKWSVCFGLDNVEEYGYDFESEKNELCDALWEAIKYVLEVEG